MLLSCIVGGICGVIVVLVYSYFKKKWVISRKKSMFTGTVKEIAKDVTVDQNTGNAYIYIFAFAAYLAIAIYFVSTCFNGGCRDISVFSMGN